MKLKYKLSPSFMVYSAMDSLLRSEQMLEALLTLNSFTVTVEASEKSDYFSVMKIICSQYSLEDKAYLIEIVHVGEAQCDKHFQPMQGIHCAIDHKDESSAVDSEPMFFDH